MFFFDVWFQMSFLQLFSWGMGTNGQLGHGGEEDAWEPVEMGGKQLETRSVVGVDAGGQHTILLASESGDIQWRRNFDQALKTARVFLEQFSNHRTTIHSKYLYGLNIHIETIDQAML